MNNTIDLFADSITQDLHLLQSIQTTQNIMDDIKNINNPEMINNDLKESVLKVMNNLINTNELLIIENSKLRHSIQKLVCIIKK